MWWLVLNTYYYKTEYLPGKEIVFFVYKKLLKNNLHFLDARRKKSDQAEKATEF